MNLVYNILDSSKVDSLKDGFDTLYKLEKQKGSYRKAELIFKILHILNSEEKERSTKRYSGNNKPTIPKIEYIFPLLVLYFKHNTSNSYYTYEFDEFGELNNNDHSSYGGDGFFEMVAWISSPGLSTELLFDDELGDVYGGIVGKEENGKPYVRWVSRIEIIYNEPTYITITTAEEI